MYGLPFSNFLPWNIFFKYWIFPTTLIVFRGSFKRGYTSYLHSHKHRTRAESPSISEIGKHDHGKSLDLYNSVALNDAYDPDSTTPQENPFRSSRTPSPPGSHSPHGHHVEVQLSRKQFQPQVTVSNSDIGSFVIETVNSIYARPIKRSTQPNDAGAAAASMPHQQSFHGSTVTQDSLFKVPTGSNELPIVNTIARNIDQDPQAVAHRHAHYPSSLLHSDQGPMPSPATEWDRNNMSSYGSYPQMRYREQMVQQVSVPGADISVLPPPNRFSNSPLPSDLYLSSSRSVWCETYAELVASAILPCQL